MRMFVIVFSIILSCKVREEKAIANIQMALSVPEGYNYLWVVTSVVAKKVTNARVVGGHILTEIFPKMQKHLTGRER